jgi:hypothetical protein
VSLRIDHVVMAVRDLDASAARLGERAGLVASPGGTHPAWGTGNRIASLGHRQYVELLAPVDPAVAATTGLGRAITSRSAAGDAWFAVCLADDALEETATRLDLPVRSGSRTLPDGRVVAWRSAGIDDPRRGSDLPFFIAWEGPDDLHPGATAAAHPSGANAIAWVEMAGDPERFAAWTDGAALPIRFGEGGGDIRAVGLATLDGEVVLR